MMHIDEFDYAMRLRGWALSQGALAQPDPAAQGRHPREAAGARYPLNPIPEKTL